MLICQKMRYKIIKFCKTKNMKSLENENWKASSQKSLKDYEDD